MRTSVAVLGVVALSLAGSAAWIPDLTVPGKFGVNIKSTGQAEPWLNNYDSAHVKLLRFDMYWSEIEKSSGVYTFATPPNSGQYNYWLMPQTNARGIRMMYILQGTSSFHDSGYAPYSQQGIAAFAAYAAACVAKYGCSTNQQSHPGGL